MRYQSFAAAAYGEAPCPTPPFESTILTTFNGTQTDTQAVLFHTSSELILSFRGTSTPRDLDTDFAFTLVPLTLTGAKCNNCSVHDGFQSAYAEIQPAVLAALAAAQSQFPDAALTVTGHSLGAGLASLAAAALAASGQTLQVYTYGEPRNGDAAFAAYVSSLIKTYYRVTHANDGVPTIPPTLLGFKHHGVEIWEKADPVTNENTVNCGGGEQKVRLFLSFRLGNASERLICARQNCVAGQDYGDNPINGAHVTYGGIQNYASSLFNFGCGYRFPTA